MRALPILLVGGTGELGGRIARLIRKRLPNQPLTLAVRNLDRARALADALGNADVTAIDLGRSDLGLGERDFSLVVPAFKDHAHATAAWALGRGVPYVALSEAAFELGPLVALYAHGPDATLAIGAHTHGGLPALVALGLSRTFETVEAVTLGAVFDPVDPLPPGSLEDIARITTIGPPPLALVDGRWRWLPPAEAAAQIVRPGASPAPAEAAGLTDALGLAGAAAARSVRLDMGEGPVAATAGRPGHDVVIRIRGRRDGESVERAWTLHDPEGNVAFGAKGIVLLIERLLGGDGRPAAAPGLYFPETLVDPADALAALDGLGLTLSAHD